MNLKEKMIDAVKGLSLTDNIWTPEGKLKVEVMRGLLGDQEITREQLDDAIPEFVKPGTKPVTVERAAEGEAGAGVAGLTMLQDKVVTRDARIAKIGELIADDRSDMKLVEDSIAEGKRERKRLEQHIDLLIKERDVLRPRETFQQAARAAAQRGLEERKRRAAAAEERGLPPGMILSPLDQALAARGRAGLKR